MSTKERVTVLPKALAIIRKDLRGMTQKELAERATEVAQAETGDHRTKVALSTIAMVESGERQLSLETLTWVAAALDVPPEAIAFIRPEPS